jgi:hypothetical protein
MGAHGLTHQLLREGASWQNKKDILYMSIQYHNLELPAFVEVKRDCIPNIILALA